MNKITKAQRDQIIAVFMGTAILIVGLYFGVISGQMEKIEQLKAQTEKVRVKASKAGQLIGKSLDIKENLDARSKILAEREATMAPERDIYAWMLGQIKPLLLNHRGITLVVSQPEPINDMNLLPHFFYKAAVFHVKGVGHFHDVGGFLSDFENGFTYFRIQGIDIAPSRSLNSSGSGDNSSESQSVTKKEDEKLDFRFDIVVPVKPSDSATLNK